MITETLYKCEICGQTYNTEQAARTCEDSHMDADYVAYQYFKKTERYPETIIMTMENGHNIQYRYDKPVIDIPSGIPYVQNVSVGRENNQVVFTAIGDNLPNDTYTWVVWYDETRVVYTSEEPRLVLSAASTRLYDIAFVVRVKVSAPSIEGGQFTVKTSD